MSYIIASLPPLGTRKWSADDNWFYNITEKSA